LSTLIKDDPLSRILFGKTRRSILALLFSHIDDAFYLRQIVRMTNAGQGAVQRELAKLTSSGLITRKIMGKQIYFQANPNCPVFDEIRKLIIKTVGYSDILKAALAPFEDRIRVAFIYGSVARGEEKKSSDVDVLIIGDVDFSDIISAFQASQKMLGREINPTVYPIAEFNIKIRKGHHFLTQVIDKPKVFLVGDENELKRLASKRVAR